MEASRTWIAGGYAEAGADGLYGLRHDGDELTVEGVAAPVRNVSAGVRHGTRWYLVDEVAGEIVVVDGAADWREVTRFSSGGQEPCHLALDMARRVLAVANYGDGTVALFTLGNDGLPTGGPERHRHDGHGPRADRQRGPHAHWVGFANDGTLYATDLGSDRVFAYTPDAGWLGPARIAFVAPPGSGPRQIAFHPELPMLYLLSELASTVTILERGDEGVLSVRQTLSTLPESTDSLGGAILIDGDRLFATNRGHDSVVAFAVDPHGHLSALGHRASGGVSPRFLAIDGNHLLVAHEQDGGVTLLPRDGGPPVARADVPGAAFLGATS